MLLQSSGLTTMPISKSPLLSEESDKFIPFSDNEFDEATLANTPSHANSRRGIRAWVFAAQSLLLLAVIIAWASSIRSRPGEQIFDCQVLYCKLAVLESSTILADVLVDTFISACTGCFGVRSKEIRGRYMGPKHLQGGALAGGRRGLGRAVQRCGGQCYIV